MRNIEFTNQLKRDFKRESKGRHKNALQTLFPLVVESLSKDNDLDTKYHDHALTGEWSDHRDCHVKPDLVLIYRKPNDVTLQLVRIGSHSKLGL
ncbi:MAG: type II toxin-antitoxin system mRNA interferase toxin, RelE/StbE family [Gammaproteobacteria bacterium]|nr:type II toxin-antitoxin system mRNA interferase toxin, RelE/StbE family [Gammaproteobacteria bacterium]